MQGSYVLELFPEECDIVDVLLFVKRGDMARRQPT